MLCYNRTGDNMFEDTSRELDTKVFEQLKLYIGLKESVHLDGFLDNPKLRRKYRNEYQDLCEYLKQNPKRREDTLEENVTYCDLLWFNFFDNLSSSEESRKKIMNQYGITEFAKLSFQELYDILNQCTREDQERKSQIEGHKKRQSEYYSEAEKMQQKNNERFADMIRDTEEKFENIDFDRFNASLEMMEMLDGSKNSETSQSTKAARK